MEMTERFAGRAAIITGAGIGGLGAAYADALAAGGASVVVADIRGPEAEATAEAIGAAGDLSWREPTGVADFNSTRYRQIKSNVTSMIIR